MKTRYWADSKRNSLTKLNAEGSLEYYFNNTKEWQNLNYNPTKDTMETTRNEISEEKAKEMFPDAFK